MLALLVFAAGINAFEPKEAGSADIQVNASWILGFNAGLPSEIELKVFGFRKEPFQEIVSIEANKPFSEEADSFGNQFLRFKFSPKQSVETITVFAWMRVNYEKGLNDGEANEASVFLKPTRLAKITNAINNSAREIISGEESDLGKVAKLAEWVHNNVRYEGFGYGSETMGSEWVYENRVGACDEYSHLLIAMLRGMGIPAKFVAGYVYSGKQWGLHAWVEALAGGKWVPIDPTFNEGMFLDATHVKFAEAVDQNEVKEEISARPGGFDINSISLDKNFNVEFDSRNFSDYFSMQVDAPAEIAGESSLETINVTAGSREKELLVPVSVNAPKDLKSLDESRLLHLRAGDSETIGYRFILPRRLEENYVYTYPVEFSSTGKTVLTQLKAQKGGRQESVENVEVKELRQIEGEKWVVLSVVLKNVGNTRITDAFLSLKTPVFQENRSLQMDVGETKEVQFSFPKPNATQTGGTLTIFLKRKQILQPFEMQFSQQQFIPLGDHELFWWAACAGILIVFVLIILFRKR